MWLHAVLEALFYGSYKNLRENILPRAPGMTVPGCVFREIEYGEKFCKAQSPDRLFPIRLFWLKEGTEQRVWGLRAGQLSHYHPEALLELWQRAIADSLYRQELEQAGTQFDVEGKAIRVAQGWVYMGETFVEDFLAIEAAVRVEILFAKKGSEEFMPVFQEAKRRGSSNDEPST